MFKFIKSSIIAVAALFATSAIANQKVNLNEKNLVVLRGEVTSQSVAKVAQQILSSSESELYLYISSPGGSILAGQSLIYVIQNSGKKIHCIVSVGASMAFAITQGCTSRLVMPHSILMQHVASYGIEGQDPNNRSMMKFLVDMIELLDTLQAQRLGMDVEKFKQVSRDDWWLYGADAVKANAADAVVDVSCSENLAQKTYKEKIRVFIFEIHVTWSSCPLIEGPIKVSMGDEEEGGERARRSTVIPADANTLKQINEVIENLNVYEVIDSKFKKANINVK